MLAGRWEMLIFGSFQVLGQMVKTIFHLFNVYIKLCIMFYEVKAVYGQMEKYVSHLSKLCAEPGQMEK